MIQYCHPLDHVCGIKYCVSEDYVPVEYTPSPDTFYVEEIIDLEKLGYSRVDGDYILYRVLKRDTDTPTVLRILASEYNIPVQNIYYVGLKDRASTSIQYMCIRKSIARKIHDRIEAGDKIVIEKIGYTRKKLSRRHHLYNKFTVIIDGTRYRDKILSTMDKIARHGLPAYYGYQRFGTKRYNTHLIGEQIVMKRYVEAYYELLYSIYPREPIDCIRARIEKKFNRLYYECRLYKSRKQSIGLDKLFRKTCRDIYRLYIQALQSYIFNNTLNMFLRDNGLVKTSICVAGPNCIDKYVIKYFEYSPITLDQYIVFLRETGLKGYYRNTLFKPLKPCVRVENGCTKLCFYLEKGFYASIVLRELFKQYYIV